MQVPRFKYIILGWLSDVDNSYFNSLGVEMRGPRLFMNYKALQALC